MKEDKKDQTTNNQCFIVMPITDPEGYEKGHFRKVYEDIFAPACRNSGFVAVRADDVNNTNLIHLDILQKLIESPMAICDLSTRNPNVLFELGLRQAFDKPTVLVQEENTPRIFDIAPLRILDYGKELSYRRVLEDQESVRKALVSTKEAIDKPDGLNSIVKLLSLTKPAILKDLNSDDVGSILQIVRAEINEMRNEVRRYSSKNEVYRYKDNRVNNLAKLEKLIFEAEMLISDVIKQFENNSLKPGSIASLREVQTLLMPYLDQELPSEYGNMIRNLYMRSLDLENTISSSKRK